MTQALAATNGPKLGLQENNNYDDWQFLINIKILFIQGNLEAATGHKLMSK
jgi:hypothetical protein